MSDIKKINTRIIHKHGLESEWEDAKDFIPLKGEIIIISPDGTNTTIPELRVGDGVTPVCELPILSKFVPTQEFIDSGYVIPYGYPAKSIGKIGNDDLKLSLGPAPIYMLSGTNSSGSNVVTENGEAYLTWSKDSTKIKVKITGTGGTTVTTDRTGSIFINSPDVDDVVTKKLSTLTLYDLNDTDNVVILNGGGPPAES